MQKLEDSFHRTQQKAKDWSHGIQANQMHSCQPLLGVNLSPVFVNLYFPYAGRGLLFFCWWQQHFKFYRHMWQWKEEAMLC